MLKVMRCCDVIWTQKDMSWEKTNDVRFVLNAVENPCSDKKIIVRKLVALNKSKLRCFFRRFDAPTQS